MFAASIPDGDGAPPCHPPAAAPRLSARQAPPAELERRAIIVARRAQTPGKGHATTRYSLCERPSAVPDANPVELPLVGQAALPGVVKWLDPQDSDSIRSENDDSNQRTNEHSQE